MHGVRKNNHIPHSEARAVIELLGFNGIKDFSKIAGVNHLTASVLLGTSPLIHQKHHYSIVRVHETLHTAYVEIKDSLTRPTRAYICDWAKRWKKDVVAEKMVMERPGGRVKDPSPQVLLDRKRCRKQVLSSIQMALNSLEWTP